MPSDVPCSLAAQARAIPLQTPPARFPSWPSATPSVVLLLTPEPKAPAAQSLTQPPPVAAADSLAEPLPGSPAEGHTVAPRGQGREVAPLPAASHQWQLLNHLVVGALAIFSVSSLMLCVTLGCAHLAGRA